MGCLLQSLSLSTTMYDVCSAVLQAQRDHYNLQKCYFLFLNSLATNNITEVIAKGFNYIHVSCVYIIHVCIIMLLCVYIHVTYM